MMISTVLAASNFISYGIDFLPVGRYGAWHTAEMTPCPIGIGRGFPPIARGLDNLAIKSEVPVTRCVWPSTIIKEFLKLW